MIDSVVSKIWLSTFVGGLLHGWSAEVVVFRCCVYIWSYLHTYFGW